MTCVYCEGTGKYTSPRQRFKVGDYCRSCDSGELAKVRDAWFTYIERRFDPTYRDAWYTLAKFEEQCEDVFGLNGIEYPYTPPKGAKKQGEHGG